MSEPCYVLMEIGCLECAIPSRVLGVYETRDEVIASGFHDAQFADEMDEDLDWRGQALRVAFALPSVKFVVPA